MEAKTLDGEDEEARSIVDNVFVPSLIRFKVDAKLACNVPHLLTHREMAQKIKRKAQW